MRSRAPDEAHRTSTNLELLFDLTFVVAVSQVAAQLADNLARDRVADAIGGYLMVFFAVWWAWVNFTWFASAYDTDDVPYRLLTLLQMAGVLVLAAGIPDAFEQSDYATVVVGYVIMRVAMVVQWVRAGRSDAEHRVAAYRYATGIGVLQLLWVARLVAPEPAAIPSFIVLAAAELSVPYWAERVRMTTWHPHHIAERYGLFTIIVLGESVLAATVAVEDGFTEHGVSVELVVVALSALVLLFGLWWLYFLWPIGDRLEGRPELSFLWGYGHYVVFAALAALGAGLEVAAESAAHDVEASDPVVSFGVVVPVVIFLGMLWILQTALLDGPRLRGLHMLAASLVLTATATATSYGLPVVAAAPLVVLPIAALVVTGVRMQHRDAVASGEQPG